MIGVTETQAKKIFTDLWANDEFEWDFEGEHFADVCNRYGLDVMNDAKYQVLKARDEGKPIRDEMQYLWGCARSIKERENVRETTNSKHPRGDDGGITPAGFNSYKAYFEHLIRQVDEDFPPERPSKEEENSRT